MQRRLVMFPKRVGSRVTSPPAEPCEHTRTLASLRKPSRLSSPASPPWSLPHSCCSSLTCMAHLHPDSDTDPLALSLAVLALPVTHPLAHLKITPSIPLFRFANLFLASALRPCSSHMCLSLVAYLCFLFACVARLWHLYSSTLRARRPLSH